MFFLLRAAFWIGLVLVLLPSDGSKSQQGPSFPVGDALSAATAAIADASRFCDRQPEACAAGSQAASALGHRAQAGAKRVYGMVADKPQATTPAQPSTAISSQNTLSGTDRAIPFRAPQAKGVEIARNAS